MSIVCSMAAYADGFVLEDTLGRTWTNELVQFPLPAEATAAVQAGYCLKDSENHPVAYQIVPGASDSEKRIAFAADVKPFETSRYQFGQDKEKPETDLKIEETGDTIRISNGKTGISIRKNLKEGDGPIEGILSKSRIWVGGSRVEMDLSRESYTAEITARGPVFAEIVCKIGAGEAIWVAKFQLQAGEPVVLVDEQFNLGGETAWTFVFSSADFLPDYLFYRSSVQQGAVTGKTSILRIEGKQKNPFFLWEPWVHWWTSMAGKWFGLYQEGKPEFLMVGARDAEIWRELAAEVKNPPIELDRDENGLLSMHLTLGHGQRRWMIGSFERSECLSILNEESPSLAPVPQQYVIKHEFPLNRVKDYILRWKATEEHPRLYITTQDRVNLRANPPPLAEDLSANFVRPFASSLTDKDSLITHYLATQDPEVGQYLKKELVDGMQSLVDIFLNQASDRSYSFGYAPHHNFSNFLPMINLADVGLADDILTPEERDRILAQAAFLGYTVTRSDYWSPERAYSANPNMSTMVAGTQVAVASLIASHPLAKTWAKTGVAELENQLNGWSDDNGGWVEAPHYAMTSFDVILGGGVMAHNGGFSDFIFDPKVKKITEWFAKISTPPDSRINGWRHLPPVGHTYISEPSGNFGIVAAIWNEKDPEFAAHMKWMHHQQGSFTSAAIGGYFPMLAGYRKVLTSANIEEKAPSYGSELFPKTGVVLRNEYPSDRETMLYFIAGSNHAHYDQDSGSVTIWGKGRIVADDFGYGNGPAGENHNLLTTPFNTSGIMEVKEFVPAACMDYVKGKAGGWTRQIVLVKDEDVLGPNFFVLNDSFPVPGPAIWRMWMPCQSAKLVAQGAVVQGKEDVDTDIFFSRPQNVELKVEEKTLRCSSSLSPEGGQSPADITQTGVIATLIKGKGTTATIYPRLNTQKSPEFASLADGQGVKVKSESGTDYIFLGTKRMTFEDGEIAFNGTVGVVQIRKNKIVLSLGAAGSISAGGRNLQSEVPTEKAWQIEQ